MAKSAPDSKLDRLDTFVLATVATILLTRTFLAITGFPQIGSNGLHIAHVLYGGVILVIAFLVLLLANKPQRITMAIIGGVGFGLFIDEVGKFVTQDNDYFYRPAIGLMYVTLLVIWFVARLLIVRHDHLPFLSPAEWPTKSWQRNLVLLWCKIQAVAGVCGCLIALVAWLIGTRSTEITYIGMLTIATTALYSALLTHGLWRYGKSFTLKAAQRLRGATLFGIVAVFPFYFMRFPTISTLALLPTMVTLIALSEASFADIITKLKPSIRK